MGRLIQLMEDVRFDMLLRRAVVLIFQLSYENNDMLIDYRVQAETKM
jgi:hypothetical protein